VRENISLEVYLDNDFKAKGTLYLDDGETFGYQRGEYIYLQFSFKDMRMEIKHLNKFTSSPEQFFYGLSINQINIYGLKTNGQIKSITSGQNEINYKINENSLSINGVNLKVCEEHTITINYSN